MKIFMHDNVSCHKVRSVIHWPHVMLNTSLMHSAISHIVFPGVYCDLAGNVHLKRDRLIGGGVKMQV